MQVLFRGEPRGLFGRYLGIDLLMYTFTNKGELEATDRLQLLKGGKTIALRAEVADLNHKGLLSEQEFDQVLANGLVRQ